MNRISSVHSGNEEHGVMVAMPGCRVLVLNILYHATSMLGDVVSAGKNRGWKWEGGHPAWLSKGRRCWGQPSFVSLVVVKTSTTE